MRTLFRKALFQKALILACLALMATTAFAADTITGLWKQIGDKTKLPESLVIMYEYEGKLYARLLLSYDDDGETVMDTIYVKKDKATKLVGDPPFCGLDYVYGLVDKGKEYRGGIMDPRTGEDYDCVVKKNGDTLIVRGQLKGFGIFGRNQTWLAASSADLPPGFSVPDPASLVPVPLAKKK